MFRRLGWLVALFASSPLVLLGCASPAEEDGSSEDHIEVQKRTVDELVLLGKRTQEKAVQLEQTTITFAANRTNDRFEDVRSEIGALTDDLSPMLEKLRERLKSPELPVALKRGGFLDVPQAEIDAEIARTDDVIERLRQLQPSALRVLLADSEHVGASAEDLVRRALAVAPKLKVITRELERWLRDFAKPAPPQWEESLLTLFSAPDRATLEQRVGRYQEALRRQFPETLKEAKIDVNGSSNIGLGFLTFAGPNGGQDLREQTVELRGLPGSSLADAQGSWFEACLARIAQAASLAPAGRKVVAVSCGSAIPDVRQLDPLVFRSDLTVVTVAR